MLTFNDVTMILKDLTYKDWKFAHVQLEGAPGFLLQVHFIDPAGAKQSGRKWYVSPFSTP
jgi:hypothetical protein